MTKKITLIASTVAFLAAGTSAFALSGTDMTISAVVQIGEVKMMTRLPVSFADLLKITDSHEPTAKIDELINAGIGVVNSLKTNPLTQVIGRLITEEQLLKAVEIDHSTPIQALDDVQSAEITSVLDFALINGELHAYVTGPEITAVDKFGLISGDEMRILLGISVSDTDRHHIGAAAMAATEPAMAAPAE